MSPFLVDHANEYVSLLQAFFSAVEALNRQDMASVEKLLHDDIVLNKIHDQLGTLRGKVNVLDFLGAKVGSDHPLLKPISPISVDNRTGTVSGLAMWEDHHKVRGNLCELIDYSFAFNWEVGGWRIRNMYASLR